MHSRRQPHDGIRQDSEAILGTTASLLEPQRNAEGRCTMNGLGELIADIVAETLWPTSCALCDRPGDVLCAECAASLDFMDYWQTCPVCGAPWGRIQCDHCAAMGLIERDRPHSNAVRLCLASLRYTDSTATLIKTFKDKGEERLSAPLANLLDCTAPPSWKTWAQCITYITATKTARRRRGFDHMELVARRLSALWGLPCLRLLDEPKAKDQRALGRAGRMGNVEGRFRLSAPPLVQRAVVVDDVLTTGSTMEQACAALEEAGCECRCLVVARV